MKVLTAPERGTRVDPRVVRTNKLIRDALRSLLSEKSFESISVQDIAERATVNRATFYAHYTDKFALLDAIVREDLRALLERNNALAASDVRAMLLALAKSVFEFVGAHAKCKIDRDFESQFERAMEAELNDFLSPKLTNCQSLLVSSALVSSAMQWRAKHRKESPDGPMREIVGVLADGVARVHA